MEERKGGEIEWDKSNGDESDEDGDRVWRRFAIDLGFSATERITCVNFSIFVAYISCCRQAKSRHTTYEQTQWFMKYSTIDKVASSS